MSRRTVLVAAAAVAVVFAAMTPELALAHCDTLDGPVVVDARAAIEKKDVTPALKWIGPADEAETRAAFARTLAVRGLSPEARELADRSFFETVVRLHRAKEGEPYTGLKPAGTDPGPAVTAVDRALETGSPDPLVRMISDRAGEAVRRRFGVVLERKKHAPESVEAGRAFTKAYAEFTHFVEGLHGSLDDAAPHSEHAHH